MKVREVRILIPDDGPALASFEYVDGGVGRYVQALVGGSDNVFLDPDTGEKRSVMDAVVDLFAGLLEQHVQQPLTPLPEPPPVQTPEVRVLEEQVWCAGKVIRESVSLGHPDAPVDAIKAHSNLPGVGDVSRFTIFAGATKKGPLYPDDTLNVYYATMATAELREAFGVPTDLDINRTYFGMKYHLSTGERALRLLDLNVANYVPLPAPDEVSIVDVRFGVARHFGAGLDDFADLYFVTSDHRAVAQWCERIGQPVPKPGETEPATYGVTWHLSTGEVHKVKLYQWSNEFVMGSMQHHVRWNTEIMRRWKRRTPRLS